MIMKLKQKYKHMKYIDSPQNTAHETYEIQQEKFRNYSPY